MNQHGCEKIVILLGKSFENGLIKMSHKEAKNKKCAIEFGVAEATIKTKWDKHLE